MGGVVPSNRRLSNYRCACSLSCSPLPMLPYSPLCHSAFSPFHPRATLPSSLSTLPPPCPPVLWHAQLDNDPQSDLDNEANVNMTTDFKLYL